MSILEDMKRSSFAIGQDVAVVLDFNIVRVKSVLSSAPFHQAGCGFDCKKA